MPSNDQDYSQFRKLLYSAFTAETLKRFCLDRSRFRPVVHQFSLNHGLDDMIDDVIEYVRTRDLYAEFLMAVNEFNPMQYVRFEQHLPSTPLALPASGSITSLIEIVIQEAKQIHETSEADGCMVAAHLALPGSSLLGENLSMEVQFGKGRQQHTLRAYVLHPGPPLRIVAELRDNTYSEVKYQWHSEGDREPQTSLSDQILDLSRDMAFQILYDLSQPEAGFWRSLRLVTAALRDVQQAAPNDLVTLEKAAASLAEVVMMDPGYRLARYNLGLVYVKMKQYRQAVKAFKEIQEAGDDLFLAATYNLGVAYYHLFENWAYRQAGNQFQMLLDHTEQREAERHSRLRALAHAGLANLCAQRARHSKRGAAELLDGVKHHAQQALALMPNDPHVGAAIHIAYGWASYCMGEWQEAVRQFKGAVRLRPTYVEGYSFLGASFLAQGEILQAQEQFQQAVVLNPRYEYAHYQLGEIYCQQGQDDQALESYRRAPDIADALNGLGKILAEKKKLYDEANTAFRRAVELNQKLAEAHSNLAWYILEAGCNDKSMLKEATEHARRAVQLNRNSQFEWHSRDVLGAVYYHRGMWDQAESELRTSIEKGPGKTQNRYHLAKLYYTQGRREQALQVLIELFRQTRRKDVWREKAEKLMRELHEHEPRVTADGDGQSDVYPV